MNYVPIKICFTGFLSKLTSNSEMALNVPYGESLSKVLIAVADHYGPEVKKMLFNNSGHLYGGLVLSIAGKIIPYDEVDRFRIYENANITLSPLAAGG